MTTQIVNKLTPEQEAQVPIWKARWLKIGRACKRTNKKKMTAAINALYEDLGLAAPIIVFGASPKAMITSAMVMQGLDPTNKEQYNEILNDAWFIQWWSGWRVFYLFCQEVVGIKYDAQDSKKLAVWIDLCKHVHAFVAYSGYCFVSDYPTFLIRDSSNRLHSLNGPALEYTDGTAVHCIEGTKYKTKESFLAAGGKNWSDRTVDLSLPEVETILPLRLALSASDTTFRAGLPTVPPSIMHSRAVDVVNVTTTMMSHV